MIVADLRIDAAEVLRLCQMPEDEIRWVLTAQDPAVVHMILELHRERLEEELAERRKALGELEAQLQTPSTTQRLTPDLDKTSPPSHPRVQAIGRAKTSNRNDEKRLSTKWPT